MRDLNPGDKVEIRTATHDGYIWNPAVVVAASEHKIRVAYPSGRPHDLNRGTTHYRRPQSGAVS